MLRRVLPLSALLFAACGQPDMLVIPDPPPIGFQVHLAPVTIDPGKDVEFCTYFNLDMKEQLDAEGKPFLLKELIANGVDPLADEIAINRIEVRGAPGLHHIQILSMGNDLEDVADKHIFECAVDLFGGPLTGDVDPIFFTQLDETNIEYTAGVGRVLHRVPDKDDATKTRGAQMLYNFHYLNPTEKPLTAEVVVNLHVVPKETITHPVRSAWWNYLYFESTAGKESHVDATGSFLVDVNLVSMTSHQHETGVDFTYGLAGQTVYENRDWSEPRYLRFEGEHIVHKDEPVNFRCTWNNSTVGNRYFGLQADDEMCTAIIEYYAVDEAGAEALLESQRAANEMNPDRGPFEGEPVTLEHFLGFPEELISMVTADPDHAFDVLDKNIICGIGINLKQMERQYGMDSGALLSLGSLLEFLTPICRL